MEATDEQNPQLSSGLDADHACVLTWDVATRRLSWSEELGLFYGLPSRVSCPTIDDVLERVHPDDVADTRQAMEAALRSRGSYQIRHRVLGADGEVRVIASQGRVECDDAGAPQHVRGLFWDVTEHAKAQEDIERWFNMTVDMLCIAGTDGYFRRLNPSWEKTLGWTPEELKARPFLDFVHPDDVEPTLAEVGRLVAGEPVISFANRYRCRDGTYRWLEWRTQPSPDGTLYAVATDVTARREADAILARKNSELSRSRRALEQFAHVASHDFQEPLRKVLVFGDRLAHEAALDERHADYLSRMMSATGRLKDLVEDVLTLVRVTGETQPEWVDLDVAFRNARAALEEEIESAGAVLSVDSMPRIWADPKQMELLFSHLLANALKFHGNRAPEIDVLVTILGGRARIRIVDNGIGFDPRYAEKIFAMFQRLHGRGVYGGTGVGLSICQSIVMSHHGAIGAFGEPGRGSTFEVELPVEPLREDEIRAQPALRRIRVVHD